MSDRKSSISDARKRVVDVIGLEPLAMVELKGKRAVNPLKRRAESAIPGGEAYGGCYEGHKDLKEAGWFADTLGW